MMNLVSNDRVVLHECRWKKSSRMAQIFNVFIFWENNMLSDEKKSVDPLKTVILITNYFCPFSSFPLDLGKTRVPRRKRKENLKNQNAYSSFAIKKHTKIKMFNKHPS